LDIPSKRGGKIFLQKLGLKNSTYFSPTRFSKFFLGILTNVEQNNQFCSKSGVGLSLTLEWAVPSPQPVRRIGGRFALDTASGWKSEGARPPPPSIAPNVFLRAGQGGGIEANVERWKGQFRQPDGKPVDVKAGKSTIHGMAVTTLDISGDYSWMGGPMAAEKSVKSGYRLLGAIVEGAGGNIFLKFTGPAKAIAANQKKFEQLLESFDKER